MSGAYDSLIPQGAPMEAIQSRQNPYLSLVPFQSETKPQPAWKGIVEPTLSFLTSPSVTRAALYGEPHPKGSILELAAPTHRPGLAFQAIGNLVAPLMNLIAPGVEAKPGEALPALKASPTLTPDPQGLDENLHNIVSEFATGLWNSVVTPEGVVTAPFGLKKVEAVQPALSKGVQALFASLGPSITEHGIQEALDPQKTVTQRGVGGLNALLGLATPLAVRDSAAVKAQGPELVKGAAIDKANPNMPEYWRERLGRIADEQPPEYWKEVYGEPRRQQMPEPAKPVGQEPVGMQSGINPETLDDIARRLGLIVKQYAPDVPILGGTFNLTHPESKMTLEGLTQATPESEILKRFKEKGVEVGVKETPDSLKAGEKGLVKRSYNEVAAISDILEKKGYKAQIKYDGVFTKTPDGKEIVSHEWWNEKDFDPAFQVWQEDLPTDIRVLFERFNKVASDALYPENADLMVEARKARGVQSKPPEVPIESIKASPEKPLRVSRRDIGKDYFETAADVEHEFARMLPKDHRRVMSFLQDAIEDNMDEFEKIYKSSFSIDKNKVADTSAFIENIIAREAKNITSGFTPQEVTMLRFIKKNYPEEYTAVFNSYLPKSKLPVDFAAHLLETRVGLDSKGARRAVKDISLWRDVMEDVEPGVRDWINQNVFSNFDLPVVTSDPGQGMQSAMQRGPSKKATSPGMTFGPDMVKELTSTTNPRKVAEGLGLFFRQAKDRWSFRDPATGESFDTPLYATRQQIQEAANQHITRFKQRQGPTAGPPGGEMKLQSGLSLESVEKAVDKVVDMLSLTDEQKARVVRFFKPPLSHGDLPELKLDTSTPLPNLPPLEAATKVGSQPFGAERIPVVGRVMGGRGRIQHDYEQSLARWYGEHYGKAPAYASALGEELMGKVKNVFKADKEGNLNVKSRTPVHSLKAREVFVGLLKDPKAFELSPEQRTLWNKTIKPIVERQEQLVKNNKLEKLVNERTGVAVTPTGVTRVVKDEAMNAEQYLVARTERIYRAWADKRLAEDPVLNPHTRKQIRSMVKEAFAGEKLTNKELNAIVESVVEGGSIKHPAFGANIYDPQVAAALRKELTSGASELRKGVAIMNSISKGGALGLDFGVGQLQLSTIAYRHPLAYAKAQMLAMGAFFEPEVFANYVRANVKEVRELAQYGSPVGRLQEMLEGLGTGQPLTRIPVFGKGFRAFGRHFQTALDVAKIEMWKAWKEHTPKKEWPELVESIENILGSGRMEVGGVSHRRALNERVMLLAPSYYRSAVNNIANLAGSGVSGKVARQSLGSLMAGGLVTFYAIAKYALKMDDEEIQSRLNPTNPAFLMWRTQVGGKTVNVGIGGIYRSLIRLAGNMWKTSTENPGNWASLSSEKNPIVRWLRGHAAPIPSMTWDAFSGKDYLGRDTSGPRALATLAPINLQDYLKGEETSPLLTATGSFGFSGFVDKSRESRFRAATGKGLGQLDVDERADVQELLDEDRTPMTSEDRKRATEASIELTEKRRNELVKGMSKDSRQFLSQHGLTPLSYQTWISDGPGRKVYLTQDEQKEFGKILAVEYDRFFQELATDKEFASLPNKEKQEEVTKELGLIKRDVASEFLDMIQSRFEKKRNQSQR